MALTAQQLSEAASIAVDYINDEVPDILVALNPLYKFMVDQKEYVSGGPQIRMPIAFKENQSKGWITIDGTDTVSLNANQTITTAFLDWKSYYSNLSITGDDILKTEDTPQAIKGLIMLKTAQAKNSMTRDWSSQMYLSNASQPKAINGLADVFGASGVAYASISNTDVPNWYPLIDSTTTSINFNNINNVLQQLKIRTAQEPFDGYGNQMKVDMILSNYWIMAQYMASEQIKARYMDTKKLSTGFEGISINGIDWYSDAYCQGSADGSGANTLYMLSSASFKLFYKYGFGKKAPFDTKGTIPNQPVNYNVEYIAGNIGCTNRRVNGAMTALVA